MTNEVKSLAGYLRIAYAESAPAKMRFLEAADLIESLSAELEQVKRERDAAVEDIKEAAKTGCLCYVCTHNRRGYCEAFEHGIFNATVMCGQYKWRGQQEVPND